MYILFQFWTSFPNFEPICCSMSGSNCCFLIYIQISQEADMVVWYSHVFKNFPQFVVIHTVKGFCTINEAEVDIFLEFSCFICDPVDVGNLISGSSAFSKSSLNILKFTVHILLKSCLENFEHYFDSMCDECNCVVVWTSFGNAFNKDCNENWPFPVLWPLLNFPNLLAYRAQHFHSIIFRTWNSSSGIPSPLLALFIVMLPKARLTSHSRMSGCRWVITPSWLSGLCRSFLYSSSVYSCHLFLILLFCYCARAHLCMKCSLGISNFLEVISSLSHSILFPLFLAVFT